MPAKTLTIRQSYHYRAPVPVVFRALTEPSELAKWFLKRADFPQQKGQPYTFEWLCGHRHTGRVLAFVKNRRVSLTWPQHRLGDTRVTFTLAKHGRGTRLRLVHTGYRRTPAWLEMYGGTQSGWAYFLLNLKSVLHHGHDLRSPGEIG